MAEVRVGIQEANGHLPAVCMSCGQPATSSVIRTMRWHPSWVIFLILIHILLYAIVASIMTRRVTVEAPLCDEHKGHWFKRNLLFWGSFVLFALIIVGAFVLGLNADPRTTEQVMPFVCVGSSVLGVIWLIIAIVCNYTSIRPKEITDDEVLLTGVSEGFVDAVEEAERERKERRAARRRERERPGRWRDDADDDEEADDRPRRKRRSDESFEE